MVDLQNNQSAEWERQSQDWKIIGSILLTPSSDCDRLGPVNAVASVDKESSLKLSGENAYEVPSWTVQVRGRFREKFLQ
jgi:hypothetical protein